MSKRDDREKVKTQKVLIITGDPLGKKLAGPAIRAWNMALLLSSNHRVTLISLNNVDVTSDAFEVMHVGASDQSKFNELEEKSDVIIFQGHAMLVFERMRSSKKIMVIDIYDPMHLEQLEQARELPKSQWARQVSDATHVLNDQLRRGDFFLCASDRQRLFWLGQLAGVGRVNPDTYENDPNLLGLIDIAPFGLSRTEPVHSKSVLKGVHPSIGKKDKLLLWSGGLYNWFDPHTLIRAMAILTVDHPEIKLFFQGTKHPHPGVPEMEIVQTSKTLAEKLGLLDSSVIFNDSWVDFDDRQNYLLEADLGVSTHHAHIETTFSFRTRILDYLWARLPMVVTEGDYFGDLVESEGLGRAVSAEDPGALAAAIESLLYNKPNYQKAKANIELARQDFFWDVALAPLVAFVDNAHVARDHEYLLSGGKSPYPKPLGATQKNAMTYVKSGVNEFRQNGVGGVANKIASKISRR